MALQLEYIENLLLFQSSKRIKELGAQTVEKPLRAKREKMIISINTNIVYVEMVRLSFCSTSNTNQSHILTDFYSNWMPRTIRPNELLSSSLGATLCSQLVSDN